MIIIVVLFCVLIIVIGLLGYFLYRAGSFSRPPAPEPEKEDLVQKEIKEEVREAYNKVSEVAGMMKSFMPSTTDGFSNIQATFDRRLSNLGSENTRVAEALGKIRAGLDDVVASQRSFENLLSSPFRGKLGEFSLEAIIADQLSPNVYGIRKKLPELGLIPDAHIKLPQGLLCLDSKFPLTSYNKIINSKDTKEVERAKKAFKVDLKKHLEKVLKDYVQPQKGTLDFACLYIPSESVFHYAIENEFELLREYSAKGVMVVSPLSLSMKLNVVMAGLKNKKLTEEVLQVKKNVLSLERELKNIVETFSVMYNHLRNTGTKAAEVNKQLNSLVDTFEGIKQ